MRYKVAMNSRWSMGLLVMLAHVDWAGGSWIDIPRHETRSGPAGGFEMGRLEVTVGEFVDYLNAEAGAEYPETAQIERQPGERYAARRGLRRQAVSDVTAAEAAAYARWLGQRTGRPVRLPTEAEWEVAARGGVDGAPYPWGWGGDPPQMARFDADGPAARGGMFSPNGFGLHDMAGNLYEWCGPGPDWPEGQIAARGGAWAERDPALLRVDRRQWFPAHYRGQDVGFRILRERAVTP
jgi:formylglycine-generating enzyme required for sulfatase activity